MERDGRASLRDRELYGDGEWTGRVRREGMAALVMVVVEEVVGL